MASSVTGQLGNAYEDVSAFAPTAYTTASLSTMATGYGLTYVTDSTATTWDGATIDISWYNTTDKVFHIKSAAQLIGLSAITSPLRGTFEESLPKDSSGEYTLTNVASNAVYANGDPIYVDTFAGKTVYLDVDVDINGGTSTATSTCDWWKPISDCNVYSSTAGGQGASVSGSFDCVQWKGTFDGQGHTVKNLYVDGTSNAEVSNNFGGYQAMFTQIGVGGVIQNVGTTGSMKGRVVGGICCQSADSDYVLGTVMSQWPRIQNCWSSVTNVNNGSGSRMSGGIFGAQDAYTVHCNIINCYSSSALSGGQSRGGIAGSANGVVAGCYFTGTISSEGSNYTGAIAGSLYLKGTTVDGVASAGVGAYVNNYALTSSTSSNGYSYRYYAATSTSPVGSKDGLLSVDELKAAASKLGDAYVEDSNSINNGYPVLFCQAGLSTIDLSAATVAAVPGQVYTGKPITPDLTVTLNGKTLTYGTDYLIDYTNNVSGDADGNAQATVFGVGRYTGTLASINFAIEKTGLAETTITAIANQWRYPGDENSAVTPTLFVRDKDGNLLVEGTDYEVTYTNNDAAGIATATITPAEGSQTTGSNSIDFVIVDASASLNGTGTADDPYQISDKYDLQLLSHKILVGDEDYVGANYVLTADIDTRQAKHTANDPDVTPIGFNGYLVHDPATGALAGSAISRPFNGTFDGQGHTITLAMSNASLSSLDLRETSPFTNSYLALFACVGNADKTYTTSTTIKNLTVDGTVTQNGNSMGAAAVVGYSYYGTLTMENVTNKATVSTETDLTKLVGGATAVPSGSVAGLCYEATIASFTNCVNQGEVTGCTVSYCAGILAYGYSASTGDLLKAPITFTNCGNTAAITNTNATSGYSAGILGYSQGYSDLTFSQCYNTGDISSSYYPAGIMSGTGTGTFAKGNALVIDQCYNTGTITNTYAMGAAGILAKTGNYTYTVSNCYNTGSVSAATNPGTYSYTTNRYAGGIVGQAYNSLTSTGVFTVTNCYNVGTLSGTYYGDLTGQVANSTTTAKRGSVKLGGYGLSDKTYSFYATNTSAATEANLISNGNIVDSRIQVTEDEMKGATVLAGLGELFKADGEGNCSINGGYPVLAWQTIPTAREYGEPVITFSEDGKSATATWTEKSDSIITVTRDCVVTSEQTKDPTCTEMGETTYTATVEAGVDETGATLPAGTATKVVADVPAKGHSFGDPVITFAEDSESATAVWTCSDDKYEVSRECTVTDEPITQATCTTMGEVKHTAVAAADEALGLKGGTSFVTTRIPALGHDYGNPTITFGDDGKTALATWICKNDVTHTKTRACTVTSEVTKPATCTKMGETTYTATIAADEAAGLPGGSATTTIADVPMIEHSYGDWVITTMATPTAKGVCTGTCSVCGDQTTKELDATGWVIFGDGTYYLTADSLATTGWTKAGTASTWYYLDPATGAMVTGWTHGGYADGRWYYMNTDGSMATAKWIGSGSTWYYVQSNGVMAASKWLKVNGSWYWFKANGRMATGWDRCGTTASWYYLGTNGKMVTGWTHGGYTDGRWYYMLSSGKMASATTLSINGKSYTFAKDGRLQ